jgi:AcrR family transcriptional regulator
MARALRHRADPEETRNRILAVAEEMFRRIGYQKTAVADIAAELGMSPANVYRFFSSKSAINEAICERVVDGIVEIAFAAARSRGTPAERLERLMLDVYRHTRSTLIAERKMHDMVATALDENWPAIKHSLSRLLVILEGLIREGNDLGEFDAADPAAMAQCLKMGFAAYSHPVLIAQSIDDDPDRGARMLARFLVDALRVRPQGGVAAAD